MQINTVKDRLVLMEGVPDGLAKLCLRIQNHHPESLEYQPSIIL